MAFAPIDPVISSWRHLFEDVQTSPKRLYAEIEKVLDKRQVPDTQTSRIQWPEAGPLSSWREYLRVERLGYRFDICAAPFGSGFFVSWWLVRPLPRWWAIIGWHLVSLAILATAFLLLQFTNLALAQLVAKLKLPELGQLATTVVGFVLASIGPVLLLLFVYHGAVRLGATHVQTIQAIFVFGPLYLRVFNPVTYYQLDTAMMFGTAVHNAVLEAQACLTEGKGFRPLTELERQPVFGQLLRG